MKKILIALFASLFFVGVSYGDYCDQSFNVVKLRHGKGATFYDEVYNKTATPLKIKGFKLDFNSRGDFGRFVEKKNGNVIREFTIGKDNLLSHYSDWVISQNKMVQAWQSGIAIYTHNYEVLRHPHEGNKNGSKSKYTESDVNSYDLFLRYTMVYNHVINGQDGTVKEHTECQPYNISWCGDGILDREFSETCDPKDPNKTGWGNGGCDEKTCQPIKKEASCNVLSASPTTGENTLTTNFTCTGTNASLYKIEIKDSNGKLLNTINSKNGTYKFDKVGTYNATCYVDNNITSSSCKQVLTVKEKKPEAKCDVLETKSSVISGDKSSFLCKATNANSYKIRIVDINTKQVVKEIFGNSGEYVFQKPGKFLASCYIDNKNTTESSCIKPINVSEPIVPKINVDKTDANPLDQDGIVGNDTQTVFENGKAIFKITVRNNGTDDLRDIYLKDDVLDNDIDAPQCDKSISEVNTILQAKFGRTYLKPNESFVYTCERQNNPKDKKEYTNRINVWGTGVESNKPVRDEDDTEVKKSEKPSIKVDKTDKNKSNDLDGVEENDTQTIKKTGTAVFKITVKNNGNEDLKNVFLKDDVLNSDVDAPQCDKSVDEVRTILKTIGNRDEIFNIGETFDYTCSRANVASDKFPYTNRITVTGVGVKSGISVTDNDPTKVNVSDKKDPEPKINVDKTDANSSDKDGSIGNDTQTIEKTGKAVFKITVKNNGNEDLKNVFLKDDVLNSDVDAPQCDKSVDEVKTILKTIGNRDEIFNIGESFYYNCERASVSSDKFPYTNKITVTGVGVESGKTVDDDDTTVVRIIEGSSPARCEKLVVSPTTGRPGTTSEFTCNGSGSRYEILVKNSKGDILETIKSNKGKYTFKDTGSYNVECYNNDLSSNECKVPVNITSSSGGGGGSPATCTNFNLTPNSGVGSLSSTVTCEGERENIEIDCGNGGSIIKGKGVYKNGRYTLTGVCNYNSKGTYNAVCRVNGLTNSSCQKTANVTSGGGNPPSSGGNYCGDGILQRPNDKGQMEECDSRGLINGKRWCTDSCELADIETFPGEKIFEFGPKSLNVIGKGMNPYTSYKQVPYIKNLNKKEGALYVYEICVSKSGKFGREHIGSTNITLGGGNMICQFVDKKLNPGDRVEMSESFLRKVKSIGFTSKDENLITTIRTKKGGDTYEDTAFLSSGKSFKVRVAKPTISTSGGGTSYISSNKENKDKISNVSNVVKNTSGEGKNSNFVGLGLTDFLSSYSKDFVGKINSKDNINITKAQKDKDTYESKNNHNSSVSITKTAKTDLKEFREYNGITGAYVITKENFRVTSSVANEINKIDKPTTYIVEGGRLIIDSDIKPKYNVAFVVKGGDIVIGNNVKTLNGTYIAIPIKSGNKNIGGNILGGENTTTNQLVVNGSLYGNTTGLISSRTYMKLNNESGQLDVGTVVSFGSSVFRKPAPLTSTFIDEYVKATKVAK